MGVRMGRRWGLVLGLVLVAGWGLAGCSQRPYRVFAVQIAAAPPAVPDAAGAAAPGVDPVALALPGPRQTPSAHSPSTPWDLNRVTVAALTTLPGMDAATAQAIVAHQPYPDKRDLLKRHILTPAQYARWKQDLVVHRAPARAPARPQAAAPAR